jgi:hypothetical protein
VNAIVNWNHLNVKSGGASGVAAGSGSQ